MASRPHPPSLNPPWPTVAAGQRDMRLAAQLVENLLNPDLRLRAFVELAKNRDYFKDLAPLLWNSFGIMPIILEEIRAVYHPLVASRTLTIDQRNRACNVLVLLGCLASDPRTKTLFRGADIPNYLVPFLWPSNGLYHYEFLRLTSLQVIGAFVRIPDPETINYLISTEIVSLCLHTMKTGDMSSKTVATYIVHNVLLVDAGLNYLCLTANRFFYLNQILGDMVVDMAGSPYASSDLLAYIVSCYLQIADHQNACYCLKNLIPKELRDGTFGDYIMGNPGIGLALRGLMYKLGRPCRMTPVSGWLKFDHGFR